MNPILQGLSISLLGLTLTFAALGLFILVIVVLQRVFRVQTPIPEEREEPKTVIAGELPQDTEDEEVTAAITIALSYLRSLDICRSGLGSTLEAGRGAWWSASLSADRTPRVHRT